MDKKNMFDYPIPLNVDDGGGFFGGQIKTRNAVEAFISVILVFFLLRALLFFIGEKVRIVIALVLAIVVGIFFLAGIDGRSITEYLILWIRHKKSMGTYVLGMPVVDEEEDYEE